MEKLQGATVDPVGEEFKRLRRDNLMSAQEAERRGLIGISPEQAEQLAAMSPEQRRRWAASVRKRADRAQLQAVAGIHPAAREPDDPEAIIRKRRNARKRAARARRG